MDKLPIVPKLNSPYLFLALTVTFALLLVLVVLIADSFYQRNKQLTSKLQRNINTVLLEKSALQAQLVASQSAVFTLQNSDPITVNVTLAQRMRQMETVFSQAGKNYENLVDLKIRSKNTQPQDGTFALVLNKLAQQDYAGADEALATLSAQIKSEYDKINAARVTSSGSTSGPILTDNKPPSGGYRRQMVSAIGTSFLVDIITIDLNSARAIVDTASDSDCGNNCPVVSLSTMAQRSGAFAGINGTFFCPTAYPSCAGKTNSFDLLVLNKNKKYFNSDNNVYSINPAVAFYGSTARFMGKAQEWGRDTGVDAVISNYPLLVQDGHIVYGGSSDSKFTIQSPRSFIGASGSTAYIGVIHGATLDQAAQVIQTLGIANAMNLDDGGSSALWFSGAYMFGPGRDLANSLLFVRK